MTIFVIRQLRVTLEGIHNSCDVSLILHEKCSHFLTQVYLTCHRIPASPCIILSGLLLAPWSFGLLFSPSNPLFSAALATIPHGGNSHPFVESSGPHQLFFLSFVSVSLVIFLLQTRPGIQCGFHPGQIVLGIFLHYCCLSGFFAFFLQNK